jgi:predicted metalloprotease
VIGRPGGSKLAIVRTRLGAFVLLGALGLAACGSADPGLRAGSSDEISTEPIVTIPDEPQDSTPPPPDTTPEEPIDTLAPVEDPNQIPSIPAGEFPLDANKPPQSYDGYLITALEDIQQYWRDNYPLVYGEPYQELQGAIWPVYPGKLGVPGCGTDGTPYEKIEGNAFYCSDGDFVAYDDANLLPQLEAELGTSVIGVILAHEWGHAIQARSGAFAARVPTVTTELQADCFAGAWAAHLSRGENPALTFRDSEIKTGLLGMIVVADSPGSSSADPAAHGSAFDRVGAFQDGYINSVGRCGEYIANQPTPIQFGYTANELGELVEDSPFEDQGGCTDTDPNTGCGIFELLIPELNIYWTARVPGLPELTVQTYSGEPESVCSQLPPSVFIKAAFYCPGDGIVYVEPNIARAYYDDFGDFSIGYLMSYAWADAAQTLFNTGLEGEQRVLVNDCLVGAFTRTGLPPEFNPNPSPNVSLSPGDLDEAVKTAVRIGDDSVDTDAVGTPFDKIDSFRIGVIGDLDACTARFGG